MDRTRLYKVLQGLTRFYTKLVLFRNWIILYRNCVSFCSCQLFQSARPFCTQGTPLRERGGIPYDRCSLRCVFLAFFVDVFVVAILKNLNEINWEVDELTHVSRKLDDASRKLELLLVHVLFRRLDNTSRKLEPLPVHFLYRQLNNAPKTRSMCPFMFSHGGSMIHQGDASSK